ncbi:B12-dependent dehydatase associated subunit protein [Dioscorea alata]|uniref:B12-dependent dehydatase associated subunit protein n=1 Tax=Dioscorea alata TaxID=55571 RepID=A0ACB7VK00_DIOAL|nr:B12-dependent dehydatase associated subunit protein [Dioscorea alata]
MAEVWPKSGNLHFISQRHPGIELADLHHQFNHRDIYCHRGLEPGQLHFLIELHSGVELPGFAHGIDERGIDWEAQARSSRTTGFEVVEEAESGVETVGFGKAGDHQVVVEESREQPEASIDS